MIILTVYSAKYSLAWNIQHSIGSYPFSALSFGRLRPHVRRSCTILARSGLPFPRSCAVFSPSLHVFPSFVRRPSSIFARQSPVCTPPFSGLLAILHRFARRSFSVYFLPCFVRSPSFAYLCRPVSRSCIVLPPSKLAHALPVRRSF